MKKTIYLYGPMGKLHPEPIDVEAETIAEALAALVQFPELAPPPGHHWPVVVRGVTSNADLYARTPQREIHVHPQAGGGGGNNSSIMQVVIGVALIAVAIVQPQFLIAWGANFTSVALTGGLMVLSGLVQMLTPMPDTGDSKGSNIASAANNTTEIGTPIPIAYGTQKLAGHYLSYDVDAVDWSGDSDDDSVWNRYTSSLPRDSATVGVAPLPGAKNSDGETEGLYIEYDKPSVKYALLNPVFQSQTTGPNNVPTSSWVV
jgi:predicted phage tail protein